MDGDLSDRKVYWPEMRSDIKGDKKLDDGDYINPDPQPKIQFFLYSVSAPFGQFMYAQWNNYLWENRDNLQ
jgi:hypothetical protein